MSTSSDPPTQTCPVCRTENDRFYTYCRECLEELPARTARSPAF
ncbi:DUF7577 domain-containing protein [Natrinema salaciae]|nr:hypothetical protein [Natrinema salaciae]